MPSSFEPGWDIDPDPVATTIYVGGMSAVTANPVPHVAFVQSCWHDDLVDQAKRGFSEVASDRGAQVDYFEMPGAFELPLHCQLLASSGRYDAIVAAGLVVDGGIYRHEFVAEAVISGLMRVQLDTGVPVLSCVLTPQQFHEHETHQQFFFDHLLGKGREAANACFATLEARAPLLGGA